MRRAKAAQLAVAYVFVCAAVSAAAATKPVTSPSTKPAFATGIYLRTAGGFVPLTKGKIAITAAAGIKRYTVPLGVAPLPEARPPVEARDVLPAEENYSLVRLNEDGQIFTWDVEEKNFAEPIEFGARFNAVTEDNVMTWNDLAPGLWAFVETKLSGIGEICYPFRVLPRASIAPSPSRK
jgi:hypothetical protein